MKVLLAGATGYLGGYIAKELKGRSIDFKAIARNTEKLKRLGVVYSQIIEAELTRPESLKGCCDGCDVVITSVGITRQKDGLSYMDVDYQANKNLLDEAIKSGVKKFIYVSVFKGDELTHLQICKAKERFVREVENSGLEYCIIRPTGFFSDMQEFFNMAKKGRVYLFGDGSYKGNPIHGADLAKVCVDAIDKPEKVIEAGGPEVLTQIEIGQKAFDALGTKAKFTFIPDWIRKAILKLSKLFMSSAAFGPIEFFLNVLVMDSIAPKHGTHTLGEFFKELRHK